MQRRVADYLERMAGARPRTVDVVVDEIGRAVSVRTRRPHRRHARDAPAVCHDCVWWQSRRRPRDDKERWIEKAERSSGAWGTVYYDDDGRVLGSMQYGPAALFPRAAELPAGPPSDDAVLVTCAYLVDASSPWVLQSLFLAAIGEARDRGAAALETFAYRYPEGESRVRALPGAQDGLPADFLADFGFRTVRTAGPRRAGAARARRARAGAGGGTRAKVLRALRHVLLPEPEPVPRRP